MPKTSLRVQLAKLFTSFSYIIPVMLTAVFSYGYSVCHLSISTDDMTADRYTTWSSELFAQGRFTSVIVKRFFGLYRNVPYFGNLLAVLLLVVAAAVFCAVLQRAARGKLLPSALTVFSCILISYPIMNEIYVYNGGNINVCLGFLLTAISLWFMQSYFINRELKYMIFTTLIMISVVSLYESFCVVYVCGVLIWLILEYFYDEGNLKARKFGSVFVKGMICLIPLVAAIAIEYLIGRAVLAIFSIEKSSYTGVSVSWGEKPFVDVIGNIFKEFIYYYVLALPGYLPIRILFGVIAVVVVLIFVDGIRTKHFTVSALYLALLFMQCSLTIIQGRLASLRTCQMYTVMVAFIIMFVYQRLIDSSEKLTLKKPKRGAALRYVSCFLAFLLVFYQAYDLNAWLCLDVQRYEEEKQVAVSIGDKLNAEYDVENLPVLFIGRYKVSDEILGTCSLKKDDPYVKKVVSALESLGFDKTAADVADFDGAETFKFVKNNLNSYLFWASQAFGEANTELLKFYRFLGYDFKQSEWRNYVSCEIIQLCNDMPAWPANESIEVMDLSDGEVIVVNLGEIPELGKWLEGLWEDERA